MYRELMDDFLEIIQDAEESFFVDVYRPVEGISAMGESFSSSLYRVDGARGTWDYPKEPIVVEIEGKKYTATGMFFLPPNLDVLQEDYLVALNLHHTLWRVIDIRNMKTHLEVSCFAPNKPKTTFIKPRGGLTTTEIR